MTAPSAPSDWLANYAYAHRGLHDERVPENSLAAFRAAMELGLGIECDIRKSSEGRAIVFHDAALDRMTGRSGPLVARTVGELTRITLGQSEETIPTLNDLLDLVAGAVPLLLELKTDRNRPVSPLCRAVRRDLEGYTGLVAIMSFDPRVPQWFAQKLPGMARGLVVTEEGSRTLLARLKQRLTIGRSRAQFLALDIRDLPSPIAARCARRAMPMASWTVRTARQLETALEAGCAPIIEGAGVAAWQARS